MAGLGYYSQLLQQNPSLAQNPAFVSALQNSGALGTNTQAQTAPTYSTSNAPTTTDPSSVTGSASSVASTAPLPIQDFGAIAQIDPTYANAATVNPQQSQQYLNQYEAATNASLQPTFQQQNLQQEESDAARGIQNTGAAGYLQGNLQGQQAATLSAAYAPLIQQGYGYSQGDIAANQANQQAVNTGNAATANQTAAANAGNYTTAVDANAAAYNNYLSTLESQGAGQQSALLSAYLNSFGANTGVTSIMGTGLSGTDSAIGNVYGSALEGEGAALGGAFGAVGDAVTAGASGAASGSGGGS